MLPFDPHVSKAVVVAPLASETKRQDPGSIIGNCNICQAEIYLAPVPKEFAETNELPTMCVPCGKQFILKEN